MRSYKLEGDAWTADRNSIDICGERDFIKALCFAKQSEREKIWAFSENKYEVKV